MVDILLFGGGMYLLTKWLAGDTSQRSSSVSDPEPEDVVDSSVVLRPVTSSRRKQFKLEDAYPGLTSMFEVKPYQPPGDDGTRGRSKTEADFAANQLYWATAGEHGYLGHLSADEAMLVYLKQNSWEARNTHLYAKGRQTIQDGMRHAMDVYSYDTGSWHTNDNSGPI